MLTTLLIFTTNQKLRPPKTFHDNILLAIVKICNKNENI